MFGRACITITESEFLPSANIVMVVFAAGARNMALATRKVSALSAQLLLALKEEPVTTIPQ